MSTEPKAQPQEKLCKACDDPDQYKRHTCGLKGLQDMLTFGTRKKGKK